MFHASAPWHSLLALLPADAVPRRHPVAPPEILSRPEGAAIAGWEQLTIDLSAGAAGLRHVLVVIDGRGRLLSANDTVLYRREIAQQGAGSDVAPESVQSAAEEVAEYRHESIGGRFEEDGSFRGTRWVSESIERAGEAEPIESTPSEPSAADVAELKALAAEVMRRAGLRTE
jgi:hypothetical protein